MYTESRRLFDHEIARFVAVRSAQLLAGSPARVLVGRETDSLQIAKMELAARRCPLEFTDPMTGKRVSVNDFVTDEVIAFLRLGFLSDWDEKQEELNL